MTDTSSNPIVGAADIFLAATKELSSLKDQNTQLSQQVAELLQQVADLQAKLASEVQANTDDQGAIKAANALAAQSQTDFTQYKQGEDAQKSALNDAIASLQKKIGELTISPPVLSVPTVPDPVVQAAPTRDPSIVA